MTWENADDAKVVFCGACWVRSCPETGNKTVIKNRDNAKHEETKQAAPN